MHENYLIENTINLCSRELNGKEYKNPNFYPEFQNKLKEFKQTLLKKHENKEGFVVMRIFDGEFYFLDCKKVGNVGKRHCSKNLTPQFIKSFKEGCYKVDILATQLYEDKLKHYNKLFPDKSFDLPMEIIYGLVSNKWLLKTFKNKITLIGGSEKMKVIKKLMEFPEYKKYVCNDYFIDYIEVPERYSCDNTDNLIKEIGKKISKSKAEVFLYGIGIAKMAIAYKFKEYKNALFIDIGCGMSALAGTTSIYRPYFGNWINYRLKNYDYKNIDPIDFENKNTVYL